MRRLPWKAMPCQWIRDEGLKAFGWGPSAPVSRAEATAALMIWVALVTHTEQPEERHTLPNALEVELTYNALEDITGLSRALVDRGIDALVRLDLVGKVKEGRKSVYILTGYAPGQWVKLPSRALFRSKGKELEPFMSFTKRSRVELNALKLYLYLASSRDGDLEYSMATYKRIHDRTGIPMEDIARAISFMESSGLVARVERAQIEGEKHKQPNRYYLTGYKDLRVR